MTSTTIILKNLTRNRLRTILTIAAIALPLFLFAAARSFVDLVDQYLLDADNNLRVAVHQKLTFTTSLPQRIRGEIEELAPAGYLKAICRTTWFGGRLKGQPSSFPNMGADRDTLPVVYSDFEMTPQEIEAFNSEKRAAVIGKQLANQMNWNIDDRVTLIGMVPPFLELEFIVKAIPDGLDAPWLYFGLDYYNERFEEEVGRPIGVNNFWLKCNSSAARTWALTEIDKHFANTDFETRTEMESTFTAAFMQSGGDWVGLVWNVGRLVVLVAVAVTFNTISMGFRERTREYALMRALGFSSNKITAMVMVEGMLLGAIGGIIAVVPLFLLTNLTEIQIPVTQMRAVISTSTAIIVLAVALACGIISAALPAVLAGRLQVAAALRRVV